MRALRTANYNENAEKSIDMMFSDNITPAQRPKICAIMTATPQHVMASAMEGTFALAAPKVGET